MKNNPLSAKPECLLHSDLRDTHISSVSEDNALTVVVADGFGFHGDRNERPVDFQVNGEQQKRLGEQVHLESKTPKVDSDPHETKLFELRKSLRHVT